MDLYSEKDEFFDASAYFRTMKWLALHKMVAYSRAGEKDMVEKVYKEFLDEMKQREDLSEEEYQEIIYFLDCQKKWI